MVYEFRVKVIYVQGSQKKENTLTLFASFLVLSYFVNVILL
jgi:hypothetical protein